MILPQLLAALEQVVETRLVQSVVAAIRRPPVAHEHAGVVGPQHRGGIGEPPAGADGVDRRLRGDERPQPVADAADAPAGLVRRDHRRVANLLAQLRVGRRGGAGRPVQHVGEAARRDLQAERGPQQVRDLRQRHPHLRVQFDHQRDDPGTELHAGRAPAASEVCSTCWPCTRPLTLRAVADLDVEAPHDRAHHGQFFLILRTPRGSLRPRRRSPDIPPEPAPRGFRRPAPGAGGSRGGRTPHRPAVRDACRDLAAGPWRTARPGGDPPGAPRPTAVSGPRSVASGGHSPVAGGCSCAATGSSRAAGSRRRAPAASTLREAVRGRWTVPQSDAGAISGRRSSHHRYATTRKIVQVKKLTPGPEPANRRRAVFVGPERSNSPLLCTQH